jgi:hypothetical protein
MVVVNTFCCYPAFVSFFFAPPIVIYHPRHHHHQIGGGGHVRNMFEVGGELRDEVKELQAENIRLIANLEMTTATSKAAVDLCSNPKNATNWVDRLGERGEKYEVFIVEMCIQLASSELSAPQAARALTTAFMMKTCPDLEPGIDCRIPGESQFKEWAEALARSPPPSFPLCPAPFSACLVTAALLLFPSR